MISCHGIFETSTTIYQILDLAEEGELFDLLVQEEYFASKQAAKVYLSPH